MAGAIAVSGLKELNKAFRAMGGSLPEELRQELFRAAQPVQQLGEALAFGRIRNMPLSPQWAEMRIGVSRATALVYMVPRQRSRRLKGRGRPNLADLLYGRAMVPALEQNRDEVEHRVEKMIDRLGADNGF